MLAVGAPKACEPLRQEAAGQKLAQLPFDEPRQALSAAAQARLGQKGLQVLPDHLVQHRVLGPAPDVGRACAPQPDRAARRC